MASENSQQRVAWPVAFGEAPRKGSRAMKQLLDFALENPININLTYEDQSSRLEYVQAIYVDNSANIAPLNITMRSTEQVIIIPPLSQAYIPVLATSDNARLRFSTTWVGEIAPIVPIHFLSFPVAPMIWAVSGSIAGGTGLDYSANAPAVAAQLLSTVPLNLSRSYVEVQNQSANPIQVVLDDLANHRTIILLSPGIGANSQGANWTSATFKGRVRVFSASALDQVAVYEN